MKTVSELAGDLVKELPQSDPGDPTAAQTATAANGFASSVASAIQSSGIGSTFLQDAASFMNGAPTASADLPFLSPAMSFLNGAAAGDWGDASFASFSESGASLLEQIASNGLGGSPFAAYSSSLLNQVVAGGLTGTAFAQDALSFLENSLANGSTNSSLVTELGDFVNNIGQTNFDTFANSSLGADLGAFLTQAIPAGQTSSPFALGLGAFLQQIVANPAVETAPIATGIGGLLNISPGHVAELTNGKSVGGSPLVAGVGDLLQQAQPAGLDLANSPLAIGLGDYLEQVTTGFASFTNGTFSDDLGAFLQQAVQDGSSFLNSTFMASVGKFLQDAASDGSPFSDSTLSGELGEFLEQAAQAGTSYANSSNGLAAADLLQSAATNSDFLNQSLINSLESLSPSSGTGNGSGSNGGSAFVTIDAVSPFTAPEGFGFGGQLATFTDPNGTGSLDDYVASVQWGEGAPFVSATIIGPDANGTFTVTGSSTASEESSTPISIAVAVARVGNPASTITDSVVFTDAPLDGTATTISAVSGIPFSGLVGTFVDQGFIDTASDFIATIDWGDGTTTRGTVSGADGEFSIAGSHAYSEAHAGPLTVVVADTGGSTVTINSTASVSAGTPDERYVSAVYQNVLGRPVDPSGLTYWTQQIAAGMPISSVAESIVHSAEYYQNFVIVPDYLKLLGRPADAAGIQYWVAQMQAGVTDQGMEAGFVATDEFYNNAGSTDADWIDAVYQLLLGRAADSAGESFWESELAGGQTRSQVAMGIAGSTENNTQLINADYEQYLGRPADSGGLAYWLQAFANGETNEDVIAGFTGSAEYYDEHTT